MMLLRTKRARHARIGAGAFFVLKSAVSLSVAFAGSACALKPIQSEHFTYSQRGELTDKTLTGAHFTFFLPQTKVKITFDQTKLTLEPVSIPDGEAAYVVTKHEPFFTRSILSISDGVQPGSDFSNIDSQQHGLIDHVTFSTNPQTDDGFVQGSIGKVGQSVASGKGAFAKKATTNQSAQSNINAGPSHARYAPALRYVDDASGQPETNLPNIEIICGKINLETQFDHECVLPKEARDLGYRLRISVEPQFSIPPATQPKGQARVASPGVRDRKQDEGCRLDAETRKECSVVYYRKKWPVIVKATLSCSCFGTTKADGFIFKSAAMNVYDTSTAYEVPIRGKALVPVTTHAVFQGGELAYYKDDRPSSMARAVLFPIEIVTSTFGVVVAVVGLTL